MAASMENARKELAGEYERVQKKAFTNWINSHLIKVGQKVNDLYEDLRDGSRLLMLIELFTGEKLRREKGKMRVHKLQNIQNVLDYLTTKKKMKLVNIHSESLVEGKPTPTLGLVWSLILRFQISGPMQPSESGSRSMSPVEVSAAELKKKLLQWAQAATEGYEEVKVKNFTTSWKDGLAFCAIIDRHRPELLNYDDCDPDTPLSNLELAMSVAEKELGIVRIIDPEDIHVEKPDDKAVMTYVSFLHNAFPDMPPSRRIRGPDVSVEEYGELFTATRKWVESKRNEVAKRNFPNSVAEMKVRVHNRAVIMHVPTTFQPDEYFTPLSTAESQPRETVEVAVEVTNEDVIAKKVEEDIQPTFDVIAEKTVIVTNEEQHVIWEGYGLRLYIPPDSLPEGCSHLKLSVNVGLSGEFQLPENGVIVSAVYSFSHDPIEDLRQPVTLEMEHCAAASALDNLSIVKANTNSNSFKYVPGGDFSSVKGYAVIKLHSFSRFSTFMKKHFRSLLPHSSNEIEYSANIYYTKMLYCHFNFEFFIIQNLSALAKRVEDQISKRVKGNYERGPISNFKFQEDELSLEIQESCGNGWNMKELTPLEVFKRDVDSYSARKELCTCQVEVWCENEEAPKHLAQRVVIKGAKKQCNFLTVTSPTTCLTKPSLPSSTPSRTTSVDNIKPKLADLSTELGDLTWSEIKSLAVQLEIDFNELLKIEEQTDQATDRMHRALNIWLKTDPNASWEKVINALDRVKGKDVLIQKLKEKYLPQSPGLQAGGQ